MSAGLRVVGPNASVSAIVLGLLLVVADIAVADAQVHAHGKVVFGSWQNPQYVDQAQHQVRLDLGIQTATTPVMIGDKRFYRLHSPLLPESDARQLVARAKLNGFTDTWFLAAQSPNPPTQPVRGEEPQPALGKEPQLALDRKPQPALDEKPQLASDRKPQPALNKQPAAPPQVQMASESADGAIAVTFLEHSTVNLDGRLDEALWAGLPVYEDMRVIDPDSMAAPDHSTRTRMFFTNKGLYVAAEMEQPEETLVARLSSRDQFINRDTFGVTIDTSGEGLYGYWFKVNLGGSLMDGRVAPERTFTEQWDGPWRGESQRTADGWSVEMFLPWSMMALPVDSDDRRVGIWLERKVAYKDELYAWPALPFTEPRFMSALQPLALPDLEAQSQLAIFPYISATHDAIKHDDDYRAGADLAWRPTPNAQLTATLNPDFGAVESDDVVVNLTAFETFFPEKRLFFLEGTEVFVTTPRSDLQRFRTTRQASGARATPKTFVPEPTTLLNTRRIGGPPRQLNVPDGIEVDAVELGKPTDLLGAVKSTGSVGNLRYGVLGAFEDDVALRGRIAESGERVQIEEDGRNFGVVRALYESSGKTRRSLGYMGTLVTLPDDNASAHAVDAHYLSAKGKIKFDGQVMASDTAGLQGYGALLDMVYTQRRGLTHFFALDYIDDQFNVSDLGFIRQNDIVGGQYGVTRQSGGQPGDTYRYVRNALFISAQSNTNGFLNRAGIFSNHTFLMRNNNQFRVEFDYYPRRWDDVNSRGNGMYKTDGRWFTQFGYGTDSSKRFSWSGTLGAEQEELDGTWTYASDLGLTYTPTDNLSFELDVTYKKRDGWLLYRSGRNLTTYAAHDLKPRLSMDYFLTARQQLRLTMQWAGIRAEAQDYWLIPVTEGELVARQLFPAADNEDFSLSRLTAQLRYRWEIGPLSDLFVVYTRGSNLMFSDDEDGFGSLFDGAIDQPVVDFLVVKLRYRFGT